MKICYFPGRETGYSRNRILVKGMREAGIEVYDCSYSKKSLVRYFIGFYKFLKYQGKSDVVFIGFLGQALVPIVKIFTRKTILFDAFVSIYQTLAFDRKSINPNGILAKFAKFLDCFSCQLADKVILDTQQHINFFVNEFNLPEDKFYRIFVGSDDSVMYPRFENESEEFLVHFHGEFQSLHGAEYIVEAAKLLPDIKFQMIGKGRDLKKCIDIAEKIRLKNIEFIPPVSYEKLAEYMARATVCLGIFGSTPKTQMVIPHKVYEALAMGKAVITADSLAIRELLTPNESVMVCEAASAQSLANAIKILKKNTDLRRKYADQGYKVFKKKGVPLKIGQDIFNFLKQK